MYTYRQTDRQADTDRHRQTQTDTDRLFCEKSSFLRVLGKFLKKNFCLVKTREQVFCCEFRKISESTSFSEYPRATDSADLIKILEKIYGEASK